MRQSEANMRRLEDDQREDHVLVIEVKAVSDFNHMQSKLLWGCLGSRV